MVYKEQIYNKIEESNLPSLISKYDINDLIVKAMQRSLGTYHGFELLLCATSLFKTGSPKLIDDDDLDNIIMECEKILLSESTSDILAIMSIRHVRGLRPAWFSWPIYAKILEPFNSQIKKSFGFEIEKITQDIYKFDSEKNLEDMPICIKKIKKHITIKHEDISTPGDLWDKLFVIMEKQIITLSYKIADIIYQAICKELRDRDPKFNTKKGKSLENLVKSQTVGFLQSYEYFHNYEIDKKEKDLIFIGSKMGWAIESKAMKIRSSSADWSDLNAIDDMDPILEAMNQIIDPLNILKNGGKIVDKKGLKHKIHPKDVVFGFIVTDQIYSPYIRASIDDIIKKKESPLVNYFKEWHGNQLWIGSIIDLCFLFQVSLTPSVLIDYLQWLRSEEKLKFTDETESWLCYGTEPLLPLAKRKMKTRVLLSGFGWEKVKKEGIQTYFPFWISRADLIKESDKEGNIIQAINIVKQERDRAERFRKKKMKE